jgi:hypothetical protein
MGKPVVEKGIMPKYNLIGFRRKSRITLSVQGMKYHDQMMPRMVKSFYMF